MTVVRGLIRAGTLSAIQIGARTRITPEAIHQIEIGPLSVKPVVRRKRETIPAEVQRLLDD